MIVLLLVTLLLLGGGAYYYFKVMPKQGLAAASLPAAATPAPQAVATPAPQTAAAAAPPVVSYNSQTEQKYIDQADHEFMAVQQPKVQAFNDAFAAFKSAGYISPKGLTTKESVAARRELIAKCIATNDDYAAFVATQETTFKDALSKTPLTPADVQKTFENSAVKARTQDVIKLRQGEHDYLKGCDDMMAALEKWYGNWSVSAAGKLQLKRKENIEEYNSLAQKCNALAANVSQLQNEYNAWGLSDAPSATASPAAASPAPSAAGAPAASASPAATP